MAAQRQPKRWPPRSQPRARATGARSRSRTFLCPANYRRYASRTLQPAAPKRRAIEFCRPPGFPPSGVQKFHQHNIYLIALHCKCQEQAFGALLINDFRRTTWGAAGEALLPVPTQWARASQPSHRPATRPPLDLAGSPATAADARGLALVRVRARRFSRVGNGL
jgi:hypothetical protein